MVMGRLLSSARGWFMSCVVSLRSSWMCSTTSRGSLRSWNCRPLHKRLCQLCFQQFSKSINQKGCIKKLANRRHDAQVNAVQYVTCQFQVNPRTAILCRISAKADCELTPKNTSCSKTIKCNSYLDQNSLWLGSTEIDKQLTTNCATN